MINLPNKDQFIRYFSRCYNWEDKYLYIIELGEKLLQFPKEMRTPHNLITGCQNQVWISLSIKTDNKIQLYGDSEAAIVKGLIAITFIIYQGLTAEDIISYDAISFFSALSFTQHLTPSRSHGLKAMIQHIRSQATTFFQ
ncbi:SufE protein probably involved in Fe-S center assembly [secondary endosymbiont of Heteropsylla cubana]|uniref:SufE protein probably involved in Fe-S center assembly n=1 Tax=secondary endosymbiont of Heteropsylla cubana TaxID=134287 RepID=J3Z5C0_9ENTR|nr:cysteine desulfuration protein SufE [secondary endosymbiont of Heteropsylla cubana]AFP85519.1 SufE protein probably involved in Fe-S center assembly [secondary endosymbiont of Heteropsylla cubana]